MTDFFAGLLSQLELDLACGLNFTSRLLPCFFSKQIERQSPVFKVQTILTTVICKSIEPPAILSKHHFVNTKNQFYVTKSCLIVHKRKEYIINYTKQSQRRDVSILCVLLSLL